MASPPKRTTTMMKEDPVYKDLMKSAPPALHNYYHEFRLGQGDPLLRESMKHWPITTVYEEPKLPPKPTCTTLSNPMSGGGRRGTWPGAHTPTKQVPYDPVGDYCEYMCEDAS